MSHIIQQGKKLDQFLPSEKDMGRLDNRGDRMSLGIGAGRVQPLLRKEEGW